MIDATRLAEVFRNCLFNDDEIEVDHEKNLQVNVPARFADGIRATIFGFHEGRLQSHRETITGWLAQLPEEFGEGWSFLEAYLTRSGEQWGEHRSMEELFVLGCALGICKMLSPRFMWPRLPGGMPYFKIDFNTDLYDYERFNNFVLPGGVKVT